MCGCLLYYSRTNHMSFVYCIIFIGVIFNFLCYYYLMKSPSPWMNRHGPFHMSFNYKQWSCKDVRRSDHPLPITALVSFPGSGNTWVRHMIQQASGIATGSVYNDYSIKYRGFPAEGIHDNTVSMIKTHGWGATERAKYEKAVILIRDPFDSLNAEFNRQRNGHLGQAREPDYKKYWQMFINDNSKMWLFLYLDWFKFKRPVHVIQFQHLLENPIHEVRKLLRFLALKYDESDIECMLRNKDGAFRRRSSNSAIHRFTYYMKSSIKSYKQNVTIELDKFLSRKYIVPVFQ